VKFIITEKQLRLFEKIELKSRAKDYQKDFLKYYEEKLNLKNIHYTDLHISVKNFKILPDNLKEKFVDLCLYQKIIIPDALFRNLNNDLKLKYVITKLEEGEHISDFKYKWYINSDKYIKENLNLKSCVNEIEKDNNGDWGMKNDSIKTKSYIITNNVLYSQPEKWEIEWFKEYIKKGKNINENIYPKIKNELDDGKYLYHFTETYLLDLIKKEGLKPNKNPNYNGSKGVFLTKHLDIYRTNLPQRIMNILDEYYDNPKDYEEKPIVRLKIDISKLNMDNFTYDDDYILNSYGWNKAKTKEEQIIESLDLWGTIVYLDKIPANLIVDYSFDF
jgi:hypothetical protein